MSDAVKTRYEFSSGAWIEFKTKLSGRKVFPVMAKFSREEGEKVTPSEIAQMGDDLLPLIVAAWSWPGDPTTLDAYDELEPIEYTELIGFMGEYIAAKTAGKAAQTTPEAT